MSAFAVHALLSVKNGITDEATKEADSFGEALALISEIAAAVPTFHAITLVHAEDAPALLEGAMRNLAAETS